MVRCVLRKTLLATVVGAGIEEIWGEWGCGNSEEVPDPLGEC